MSFKFGTKAETLHRLRNSLSTDCIGDLIYFDVNEWKKNKNRIINQIQTRYQNKKIIIRSSAQDEDGSKFSMAGAYLSLAGILTNKKSISNSVEKVINSYKSANGYNHLLVQPMVENTIISGVVLTKHMETGSPYYIINYDDKSGSTDTITGGKTISKCLNIRKSEINSLKSTRFLKLLKIIKEIELVVGNENLDIEFAIKKYSKIFIFQVRPITVSKKWKNINDNEINLTADNIKKKLVRLMKQKNTLHGYTTILGDMPDWNPAEMIGSTPRPLSLSLYKYLITDSVWQKARMQMGYKQFPLQPLLIDFYGKPFIDVRKSLNSFLPHGLPHDISEKIINCQLNRLKNNIHFHDKIEFEVAISCKDFSFNKKIKRIFSNDLTKSEIKSFDLYLTKCTRKILETGKNEINTLLKEIALLKKSQKFSSDNILKEINSLLNQCKKHGTLPFSKLARHGFMGIILLKSLVDRKLITNNEADNLLLSLHTIVDEVILDTANLISGKIDKKTYLKLYGYLRPGTYDILSYRYDEKPSLYIGKTVVDLPAKPKFLLSNSKKDKISKLLDKEGFNLSSDDLFDYISSAICAREKSKFEFTKYLSEALKLLTKWGRENGFSRDDLSFVDIKYFKNNISINEIKKVIFDARKEYNLTRAIQLPNIITSPLDVDVVRKPLGVPTFITNKIVTSNKKLLTINLKAEIINKIVFIESADPGYDWIFSHNINGLVTQYGGANSHMAIRCSEFSLPAAIGCGDRLFNNLLAYELIELNCLASTIKGVK